MLLVKYSHNLVMKTKRKKSSAAAETVAPKKGRPAKVYTIEDAVRMVIFTMNGGFKAHHGEMQKREINLLLTYTIYFRSYINFVLAIFLAGCVRSTHQRRSSSSLRLYA
jgi:hypothetical protein